MTCICAAAQSGRVVMGGDCAATNESDGFQVITATPKVMRQRGRLLGFAGDWRAARLIRSLRLGDGAKDPVDEAGDMVDQLEAGWKRLFGDDEFECDILIGYCGRIFVVEDGSTLYEPAPYTYRNKNHRRESLQYMAVGLGGPFAIGALSASAESGITLQQRVTEALEISSTWCSQVRPPFTVLEV